MRWTTAALGIFFTTVAWSDAQAHPHVWVDMRSDVVFDDEGRITGLNLMWTFDDAYAKLALEGLDTNGDGVYSQEEMDPLTKENLDSLKDYDYFTVVRFNGEKQLFADVIEYGQIWSNEKLALHFQVPLKTPIDPVEGAFDVKVYDPEFFIDFSYAEDEPVSVVGNMPRQCRLDVGPVPTGDQVNAQLEMLSTKGTDWKPDTNEDFGAMFAQPVTIQCGS